MSSLDVFTVVTGVATLVSFALQVFDLFPVLKNWRERAALIFLGVFVGSLLRAVQPGSIKLNLELTGFAVLVGIYGAALLLLALIAALARESQRREEVFTATAIGFIPFIFVLFIGSMLIMRPPDDTDQLTIHELDLLAKGAEQSRSYERAEMFLHRIETRLSSQGPRNDLRLKTIEQRIAAVRAESLQK